MAKIASYLASIIKTKSQAITIPLGIFSRKSIWCSNPRSRSIPRGHFSMASLIPVRKPHHQITSNRHTDAEGWRAPRLNLLFFSCATFLHQKPLNDTYLCTKNFPNLTPCSCPPLFTLDTLVVVLDTIMKHWTCEEFLLKKRHEKCLFKVVKNGEAIFPGCKWLILIVTKLYFVLSLMKSLFGKCSIGCDILLTQFLTQLLAIIIEYHFQVILHTISFTHI